MARPRAGAPPPGPLRAVLSLMAAAVLLIALASVAAAQGGQEDDGRTIPDDSRQVRLESAAAGLAAPVFMAEPDDRTGRRFIVDQAGSIRILTEDGDLLDQPFLDIADRLVDLNPRYDERGLLGLAFHPEYADNGRFFVYYSAPARSEAPEGWNHTSRVSEFRASADDPDRADPASERIVMAIDQPFNNHNAGHIAFGRDGYLRVPLGDGGNAGDRDPEGEDLGRPPRGYAQTPSTLLGSILRIDVDAGDPYGIPTDNPFLGDEDVRPEVWAYGFRNPYGFAIDLGTGDFYAADAGQLRWEEVSIVRPGGNHGWNIREGTHCFDPDDFLTSPDDCPETGARGLPLVPPVIEYARGPERGSVIVPAVRYRGERMPAFSDSVVFGDYSEIRFRPDGVLYVADEGTGDGTWPVRRLPVANARDIGGGADGGLGRFLLGITQDADGELYALTTREGGPTGSTGEVFAIHQADAAGGTEGDDGGVPAWAWILGAGVLLLIGAAVAGAIMLRRRGAPGGPAP